MFTLSVLGNTTCWDVQAKATVAVLTHIDPHTPLQWQVVVKRNRRWYAGVQGYSSCSSYWMPSDRGAIYARFPIVWALLHPGDHRVPGRESSLGGFEWVLCVDFDILLTATHPLTIRDDTDLVVASNADCLARDLRMGPRPETFNNGAGRSCSDGGSSQASCCGASTLVLRRIKLRTPL